MGRSSDSDTGRLRCTFALNHFAWLPDGAQRMDAFLDAEAPWMDFSERERLKNAALADMQTYEAAEAGEIVGLTWAFRCDQNMRTMIAIDTPPADVLDARRKEKDADYQRESRAIKRDLPKSPPANMRRAEELQKRRVAAIHAALSTVGQMSIADLCRIFGRAKNGPFNTVKAEYLPRVVRRVIGQDQTLRTEIRGTEGRPDLRPSMWVLQNASTTKKETVAMTNRLPRPATAHPTTAAGYRFHFQRKLATFTPETAHDELPAWFNSTRERALVEQCGVDRAEFFAIANQRRKELLAQRQAASEA